jgi:hypothetical protein
MGILCHQILTDSDSNLSCPLIFPEMTSVYHPLGQILCGEEGEARPSHAQYAFSADQTLRGVCGLDGTRIGHNTVVRWIQAVVGKQ